MALREIELLGAEVLRRPAAPVGEVDDEVRALIDDMFETMYRAEGVGLAAPQVGVSRRVVVVDLGEEGSGPLALADPRVVEKSDEEERAEEGCLSVPGVAALVQRPLRVTIEAAGRRGEPVRLQAEGLLARCLQHEVDHLDGILFLDRVSPLKRRMLLKQWKKQREAGGS